MKRTVCLFLIVCILTLSLTACGKGSQLPLDSETRLTVKAVEGRDYTIDYVKVSIADTKGENGSVVYTDYAGLKAELMRRKELGEEIHFRVTVKYTALRELAYVKAQMSLNFWSFDGGNQTLRFWDEAGGSANNPSKSQNLLKGEHHLSFDVSIQEKVDEYSGVTVIENLDALDDDLTYEFYTYQN